METNRIEKRLLGEIANLYEISEGAYNFRINGKSVGRNSTTNINVGSRKNNDGLEIRIKAGTKNESVHIPIVISLSGLKEVVYNDFYVGEGAEVTIIAGCGIYNCGGSDSVHNGIHRIYVGKNSKVKYVEKHYGLGRGGGGKILNPMTEAYLEKGSELIMELEQIKGVDSARRRTVAKIGVRATLRVEERIMTHGRQKAESLFKVNLAGEGATVDIISRAVAQDLSKQKFSSRIIGEGKCRGHSECDGIIMDRAKVVAVPALEARSVEAELVHEAAIGKIAGEQIMKLMTLGLDKNEAESKIINGFLK